LQNPTDSDKEDIYNELNDQANKMGSEQRKSVRFIVHENVSIALRGKFTKVGRVKDISMKGLAFEHIEEENQNSETLRKDIFLWVNGFSLSKLPGRIVYDVPLATPDEYQGLFIHLITRRCGVQFETLSEDQASKLDFFLKTYTTGEAP